MGEHTPVVEQPLVEGQSATPWSEGRQRLETPERGRIYWCRAFCHGRPWSTLQCGVAGLVLGRQAVRSAEVERYPCHAGG